MKPNTGELYGYYGKPFEGGGERPYYLFIIHNEDRRIQDIWSVDARTGLRGRRLTSWIGDTMPVTWTQGPDFDVQMDIGL